MQKIDSQGDSRKVPASRAFNNQISPIGLRRLSFEAVGSLQRSVPASAVCEWRCQVLAEAFIMQHDTSVALHLLNKFSFCR